MLDAFDTFHDVIGRVQNARRNHLGYPYNLTTRSSVPETLHHWLINNLGDPYSGSHFASEVCDLEREVVQCLMQLWQCDDGDSYWGSVGASGTEGNLWALYLAREALPDATLIYSRDAHYSIAKAARILRMAATAIDSHPDGTLDNLALAAALQSSRSRTVILALTCGTTFKGAHDDLAGAVRVLDDAGIGPQQRYVHVDGALNAMVLPFVAGAPSAIRPSFRLGIDSISTSGHKMIGTPMPCGVLIARRRHVDRISATIAYLRSNDTTLMGSRNGHAVLALWARLRGHGQAGFTADADACLRRAQQLAVRLAQAGTTVLLNPHAMTVVFPEPTDDIVRKYQLACHQGKSHAIVMPSTTDALLDQFCCDYLAATSDSLKPRDQLTRVSKSRPAHALPAQPVTCQAHEPVN